MSGSGNALDAGSLGSSDELSSLLRLGDLDEGDGRSSFFAAGDDDPTDGFSGTRAGDPNGVPGEPASPDFGPVSSV